jgi:hypothetical protein
VNHCKECGAVMDGGGRSLPDHRRLFSAIAHAFHHWPEGEFIPRDPEHLRSYLLLKVGHTNVAFIPAPEGCSENPAVMSLFKYTVEGTANALSGKAGYYELRVSAGGVEIVTPRSLDFRTVSRKEFGPIRDAVEALIELTVGVPVDQLLRENAA